MSSVEVLDNFFGLVRAELRQAMQQHKSLNSSHEAYAVILEELDEFWEEVRKKKTERNTDNMLKELVQIAAMCARTAHDLELIS